ncbi:MAG: protein kinase family protein, partial [Candidatus Xenobia bacterium]
MERFLLAPGATLKDRYRIEKTLQVSFSAAEYAAREVGSAARLRVRHLHLDFPNPSSGRRFRHAFRQAAAMLPKLHHRALTPVIDAFDQGPDFFIVGAWVEGATLASIEVPVPAEVALRWMLDVLDAMEVVAAASPLCALADLVPQEVRLRENGSVLLGMSRFVEDAPSQHPFAAPDSVPGVRAQIYSAGALAWWLLLGESPPEPEARRAAAGRLPRALARALLAMLSPDPGRRPASPAACRRLLLAAGAPRPERDRHRRRRPELELTRPGLAAAGAALGVLLFCGACVEGQHLWKLHRQHQIQVQVAAAATAFRHGDWATATEDLERAGNGPASLDRAAQVMLGEAELKAGQP